MYSFSHDEAASLAVWVLDRPEPDDWKAHFGHMRDVARWSTRNKQRAAVVIVPGGAFDRPDALGRAELSRLSEAPGYDPFLALVTPNVAARGMVTMIKWLQMRPRWELEPFGDVAGALDWLEQRRGEPLPGLRIMVERTLRQARDRGLRIAILECRAHPLREPRKWLCQGRFARRS